MKCPGCEAAKRLMEAFRSAEIVAAPRGWMPPHLPECPAAKPTRALGMEFWTYVEDRHGD